MKKLFNFYHRKLTSCLAVLIIITLHAPFANAQQDTGFWNQRMQQIALPDSKPGWIRFAPDSKMEPTDLFAENKTAFNLEPADEMRLRTLQTDELGFTHHRYEQYHNGVKVYGSEYIVHTDPAGALRSANGKLATGLKLKTTPKIAKRVGLNRALDHADGNSFLWNKPEEEQRLRSRTGDDQATHYPEGELVIHRRDLDKGFTSDNLALAWKYDLYMGLEGESRRIFIDAETGEFLNYIPLSNHCEPGRGQTTWDGEQRISIDRQGDSFRLLDNCDNGHSYKLHTYNLQRGSSGSEREEYESDSRTWTDNANRSGVQTHWAMHRTRDYFDEIHDRNSWDGKGGKWVAYNEAQMGNSHNNACWNCFPEIAAFGGGNSATSAADDWNTLDIVGHEFTHGVITKSAKLEYINESGALNESFADIFGEMVESFSRGNNDWLMGGDRGAIRSFIDPWRFKNPRTYKGANWYTGTDDNGGVHTNSSVQNHWFYLLSVGGSGTNEYGESFNVQGIGIFKARAIAYRCLNHYLTRTDGFVDAREGSIRAAEDLFGSCSNEAIQVGKAWYAVHVGNSITEYDNQACGTHLIGTVRGINSVQAGNTCITTAMPYFGNVTFTAANEIVFRPGFTATAMNVNYEFSAYLTDCSYTTYLAAEEEPRQAATADEWAPASQEQPTSTLRSATSPGDDLPGNTLAAAPNPFYGQTTLTYRLTSPGQVQLTLYDLTGKPVRRLVSAPMQEAGTYQVELQAGQLPAGVYLCQLVTDKEQQTIRLIAR